MRKIFLIVIIISLISFTSCTNKDIQVENQKLKEALNDLQQENQELRSLNKDNSNKMEKLKKEKLQLQSEINGDKKTIVKLNEDIKELQNNIEFLEYGIKLNYRDKYKKILSSKKYMNNNSEIDIVNKYSNVYDPHQVKVGDMVGGFKVQDVYIKDYGLESVSFEGYFILTGKLHLSDLDPNYFFCRDVDVVDSLPISKTWLEYYKPDEKDKKNNHFFNISNYGEVVNELGDNKFEIASTYINSKENSYIITAVFKDFKYTLQHDTGWISSMSLVDILDVVEIEHPSHWDIPE